MFSSRSSICGLIIDMRIFVTGATGFLGAHIANVCIDKGHEVLCLKRNLSRSLFRPEIEKKTEMGKF